MYMILKCKICYAFLMHIKNSLNGILYTYTIYLMHFMHENDNYFKSNGHCTCEY